MIGRFVADRLARHAAFAADRDDDDAPPRACDGPQRMSPQGGAMKRSISVMIAALLLAGCAAARSASDDPPAAVMLRWDQSAPDPLRPQNDPPNAILVRWTPAAGDIVDPKYLAEQHCLAWDGRAEQVSEQVSGETHLAEFVCKPLRQR